MLYERFNIQLAIPQDVWNGLPTARKIAARDAIRDLQSLSVKINEGQANEEMTVIAKRHTCNHDEGLPCTDWTDV